MKSRQELEEALVEVSNLRLQRLRLVLETLETWCGHCTLGNGDSLKEAMLLGSFIDACHHFAISHRDERKALFELTAFTAM